MPSVTMSHIAKKAGVSKNTVSLALRNDPQIPPATRERIKGIAKELGYQTNPTIAHLMAQMRRSPAIKATLAILNANLEEKAFTSHPTVPTYVEGCRRRATQLGYSLDEFWLHDPSLDGNRLDKILRARGIRGVVVVGLMNENRLPQRFSPIWDQYPCVVTGVRTREPALSFTSTDQHILALRAVQNAFRLGYRRPALVLDHVIDKLVEGRFTAGVLIAQQALPPRQRVKPFYLVTEARQNPELFRKWFEKEKPDVILTLYNVVRRWVDEMGLKVPQDLGMIQLEWRKDKPDWAGMDQHNDITGEAAVEMVISMIHNNEAGVPSFPRATLIGSTWMDGATVRHASRE
jgi:LacI family transcriptional regulator